MTTPDVVELARGLTEVYRDARALSDARDGQGEVV